MSEKRAPSPIARLREFCEGGKLMKLMSIAFLRTHSFRRLMTVFGACLLGSIFFFSPQWVYAMGKKYSEQGGKFAVAMRSALVSKGFCRTPEECYTLLPRTIETDSMVFVQFYEIGEKSHAAFLTVVALALSEGIQITSGVPITIEAFRETHEKYRTSGLVIKNVKPFATIEVTK